METKNIDYKKNYKELINILQRQQKKQFDKVLKIKNTEWADLELEKWEQ